MRFVKDETFGLVILALLAFAFTLYAFARNTAECEAKGFSTFYCLTH